ncbi:MAG: hypothetical protein LC768_18895, partial [Acidobacteria bacterium]|nr:hypothetical protein [Acidobacteriota bacterium]MCA1640358.1 hypothetical protein [Acidobacteriota bacterium]
SKALSDLSGVDIKSHNDSVEDIIRAVRNWFVETVGLTKLKPASVIFNDFIDFMADFDAVRRKEGYKDKGWCRKFYAELKEECETVI